MKFFIHRFSTRRFKQDAWKNYQRLYQNFYKFWPSFGSTAPPPFLKGQWGEGLGSCWVRTSPPWGPRLKRFFGTSALTKLIKDDVYIHDHPLSFIYHSSLHYHYHSFTSSHSVESRTNALYPSESIENFLSYHSFESYAAMHGIAHSHAFVPFWGLGVQVMQKRKARLPQQVFWPQLSREGWRHWIEDPKVSRVLEVVWNGTQCHCKLQAFKVFWAKSIKLIFSNHIDIDPRCMR